MRKFMFYCSDERVSKRYSNYKVFYKTFKCLSDAFDYLFSLPMPYNSAKEVTNE